MQTFTAEVAGIRDLTHDVRQIDLALIDPGSAGSAKFERAFSSEALNWQYDDGENRLRTAVGHLLEWAPGAAATAPVGDATALADAIARVLGDESLRLAMAAAAQRIALAEDADRTAQAFEALYRELA